VDPTTGVYEVSDSKGNPTTTPNFTTDETVHLNTSPTLYGGIENSFSYRSVQLSFFIQYTKQIGQSLRFGNGEPGRAFVNQSTSMLERWQKPGDIAPIQKFDANGSFAGTWFNAIESDAAYGGSSYARLKNVAISWQLPASLQKQAGLHDTRIYLHAQNLITISHYRGLDPETQGATSLPPLRVVVAGVQIGL